MCTAISFKTKDHYFGRNLDLEYSYNETVTITPQNFPFKFRKAGDINEHYAIIGIATVMEGYPLYYDATNEKGLSIAGLNFPGNAYYLEHSYEKYNITPFELIPWILSQCKTVDDAKNLLSKTNLVNINFSNELPLTPLHWIISDSSYSIVAEPQKDGIKIYDNPVGVLTNNPTFDMQLHYLNNYMNLSADSPENTFADNINLSAYSNGMGALGLPGDLSSQSRFVRATFTKLNSVCDIVEEASVNQFFHILNSVAHPRGSVRVNGKYEITVYSSCCNTDKCIYYYTTYENSCKTCVDLKKENLSGNNLVSYPISFEQFILRQN